MSRYIEAEATLKPYESLSDSDVLSVFLVRQNINQQPSANVCEVVPCEECMWNSFHQTPFGNRYKICRVLGTILNEDEPFFCAYGERRSNVPKSY